MKLQHFTESKIYLKRFESDTYDLVKAIRSENMTTIKNILKYEFIDINYRSGKRGDTPLLFATYQNDIEIIQLLIEAGADVNKPNDNDWTPLLVASQYGAALDLCEIFVKAGANLNTKTDKNAKSNFKFDTLSVDHQQILIENFPELCKEFLIRKDADKYNL